MKHKVKNRTVKKETKNKNAAIPLVLPRFSFTCQTPVLFALGLSLGFRLRRV